MTKFPTCNLNHHDSNHGHYNKSAHEDHAVTRIFQRSIRLRSSVQIELLQRERGTFFLLPSNSNSIKFQYIHVIPVIRRIIVNFSSSRGFSQFEFPRKNIVFHLFSVLCLLFCIYTLNTYSSLWCGSTIWSLAAKNLYHKMVFSLRVCVSGVNTK